MGKLLVIMLFLLTAAPGFAQSQADAAGDVYADAIARMKASPGDRRIFEESRSAGFDVVGRGLYARGLAVFEAALELRARDVLSL